MAAKRAASAAAALFAIAIPLGGCGGGDREPPEEPPAELLEEAFANPPASGETVIDAQANLEGSSLLAGLVEAHLDGPFERAADLGLPSFDLGLDAEVAGFGVDGELVSTGDDAFVVFFGENYRVGADRVAAAEQQLQTAGAGAGGLGLDPASWFRAPRYAGAEEVEGTETERIEAGLDAAAMSAELASLASAVGAPPLLEALAAGAGPGEIEAWVAYEDHTVRRLRLIFRFRVPAKQRAATSGITGGEASLGLEVSDVGAEVEIEPPPGGGFQPIEQLTGRLRDLASLGGL